MNIVSFTPFNNRVRVVLVCLVMPPMDPKDETIKLGSVKRPVRRRKREIRVFVSSTFRDFTKEREELIKKTFREVCIKIMFSQEQNNVEHLSY